MSEDTPTFAVEDTTTTEATAPADPGDEPRELTYLERLRQVRLELPKARAQLRAAERDLAWTRALAEQQIIAEAGGAKALGANAEDRERELTVRLALDKAYGQAVRLESAARLRVEHLQAQLDCLLDARKDRRLALVERLLDAGQTGALAALGD